MSLTALVRTISFIILVSTGRVLVKKLLPVFTAAPNTSILVFVGEKLHLTTIEACLLSVLLMVLILFGGFLAKPTMICRCSIELTQTSIRFL